MNPFKIGNVTFVPMVWSKDAGMEMTMASGEAATITIRVQGEVVIRLKCVINDAAPTPGELPVG